MRGAGLDVCESVYGCGLLGSVCLTSVLRRHVKHVRLHHVSSGVRAFVCAFLELCVCVLLLHQPPFPDGTGEPALRSETPLDHATGLKVRLYMFL